MYNSGFYGEFVLRPVKDGKVVDSLNFNKCFGYEKIGFVGLFSIVGTEYNDDGNLDFNIGIIDRRGSAVVMFVIIPTSIDIVSFFDRDLRDQRDEEILQAIVESPNAVVIKQNGQNITSDFLDEYKDSIENENYAEAVGFLKEKGTDITIRMNDSNKFLLGN